VGEHTRLHEFFETPTSVGLDEALLHLAAAQPGATVDIERRLAELDGWADAIETHTVEGLRVLVYDRLDFRGDLHDYHDPANSDLDAVLQRRLGMPITLAVVLLSIARRAGIPLEAVGLPGHFLVRDPLTGELLDPFDRARPQPPVALEQRTQAIGVELTPELLAPIDDRLIVTRVVNNLTNSFVTRDVGQLDWLIALRCSLPLEFQNVGALIRLCEQRGRFGQAAELLERASVVAESEDLRHRARALRARLN